MHICAYWVFSSLKPVTPLYQVSGDYLHTIAR